MPNHLHTLRRRKGQARSLAPTSKATYSESDSHTVESPILLWQCVGGSRSVSANFQGLETNKQFQQLIAEVRAGRQLINVAGLSGSAKALALVSLQRATGRRLAVVSQRSRDLEDLERDLRF